MKSTTKLFGLACIAALGLVSCASDELKEAYAGEEISFTTRVSRSAPTTLENLDGFYVYAHAEGYSNLLINGMKAEKEDDSQYYGLENKVTWPVDVNKIYFWTFGPLGLKNFGTPEFTVTGHSIKGITVKPDVEYGGRDHKDLVVAYSQAERQVQVPLTFNHAMSQIEVRIKKGAGAEEGRVVKIKGAWIVNVHSKGDFQFSTSAANNYISWDTKDLATYGRRLSASTRLGKETHNVISNEANGGNNSGLMVLPQKFVPWTTGKSANVVEDGPSANGIGNNTKGTYIMVLCRVETQHDYPATESGSVENPAIGPTDDGKGHIHQLFPVVKNNEGKLVYDDKAYGYTCVPIGGEWLPGKKYVYTLEFCGKSSGAGVYPPDDHPTPSDPGTPRPDDKKPGDPVLDQAISFSVTVSDWSESNVPTKMD